MTPLLFCLACLSPSTADESERLNAFNRHWQKAQQAAAESRYDQAATSYEKILEIFPFEPTTHYKLAGCRARQGEIDKALAALNQAITFGWADPQKLQQDEDFAQLRQLQRFKQLVSDAANCRKELFVLYAGKGVDPKKPASLLVLLHGLGAGPRSEVPYWKHAADQLNLVIVAPRGVNEVNPSLCGWQRTGAKNSSALDYFDLPAASKRVEEAITLAKNRYAIAPDRVTLAGYSQGAGVALHLLGENPQRYCGAVSVSSLCQMRGTTYWNAVAEKKPVRVAMLIGQLDGLKGRNLTMSLQLSSAGLPTKEELWEGTGHEYPANYEEQLTSALKFVLEPGQQKK